MKTSFQIFKDFFSFVGWLAPAYGSEKMKTSFQIFKDFFSFVGWLAPAYGIDEVNSDMIPKGFVIDKVISNVIVI